MTVPSLGDVLTRFAEGERMDEQDFDMGIFRAAERVIKPTANEVGEKFARGEYFLPQLVLAGQALEKAMDALVAAMPGADGPARGTIGSSRIHADIGEIINGDKPGRQLPGERIFFSPIGLGSEDIGLAAAVYSKAVERGLGTRLEFGL